MYISSHNILTREECSLTPLFPNSNHGVQSESKGVKFKESEVMVYGYIYKIVNTLNGKVYIGQTTQDPYKRKSNHLCELKNNKHNNSHLQNAFNKYGKSNFKFTVLKYATSKRVLDKLEEDYINSYDCLNDKNGYNIRRGGANGKHSEETCKKISKARKGKKASLKARKNMSKAHSGKNNHMYGKRGPLAPIYGKKLSEAARNKISKAKKGKKRPNLSGEKHPYYGKKRPIDIIKKMSITRRGEGLFGFTGAHFRKDLNPENIPWRSHIHYNGRNKHLGYFNDPLSAEIVHDLVMGALYE